MDDNTQQTAQPVQDPQPVATDSMSSMSDVAGMTPPPPAPVMPSGVSADPMPAMPSAAAPMSDPMGAPKSPAEEDYSYAEDVLNEILDSLDRIEAKLEAIEKKQG